MKRIEMENLILVIGGPDENAGHKRPVIHQEHKRGPGLQEALTETL